MSNLIRNNQKCWGAYFKKKNTFRLWKRHKEMSKRNKQSRKPRVYSQHLKAHEDVSVDLKIAKWLHDKYLGQQHIEKINQNIIDDDNLLYLLLDKYLI